MAKSDWDTRFQLGDDLISQICEDELGLLQDAHPDRRKTVLHHWEDLARAEDSAKREYAGRYLFELLQNANDAILDWFEGHPEAPSKHEPNRVRLALTPSSLLVANSGEPFGEDNIRALCRLHRTTKTASKQIGHKGIGFKSVLGITDSPEVYSDRYAFGFDRQEFTARVRRVVGSERVADMRLPVLRTPFLRRLRRLPADERELIEETLDKGYVTVIRLPLKEGVSPGDVGKHMQSVLRPEVLLFLDAIDHLEMSYPSGERVIFRRVEERNNSSELSYKITLLVNIPEVQVHSQWLMLGPHQVPVTDRSLIKRLDDEAWEQVNAVRFSIAFPLNRQSSLQISETSQPFYVYFPTEEDSGLQFVIHADFYIGAARKDIPRNDFNDWLTEELTLFLASTGVDELRRRFPDDPALVDILAPVQETHRPFVDHFRECYLSCLSDSRFVPLGGGHYKSPEQVRFPPNWADSATFRRFFPASRLRGKAKWAFPLLEVENRELDRKRNGRPFLLRSELGASHVRLDDVVEALKDGPSTPVHDCGDFFGFIARWWHSAPWNERSVFLRRLKQCRIVPTVKGWRRPDEALIFQANLRGGEDIHIPEGFDFDLVTIAAYGSDKSYRGPEAQFLKELGVSDYDAREIIRRAILPVLESPELADRLLKTHPNAIFDVYRFLNEYYKTRRSEVDFADRLQRIPVPSFRLTKPDEVVWGPAGECYFSQYWTGSEDLEVIYGAFDDVYFLGPIPALGELDGELKQSWYGFFSWLGVHHAPRLIKKPGGYPLYREQTTHPFHSWSYWPAYLNQYTNDFVCNNPMKQHGTSRLLGDTYAIEKFEEIAERGERSQLASLFKLLGLYWKDNYRSFLSTNLDCQYTSTGCSGTCIPAYFLFALQHTAWVPATIWGQPLPPLLRTREVWSLGEAAPPEVQRLVPTLPPEFQAEEYRALRADLRMMSSDDARFEDFLNLLQRLPDLYKLDREDLDEAGLKSWQAAVRAVFNWICQSLQNGLVRRADVPPCPDNLTLLAFRNSQPCYVNVRAKDLVYPDDPFLAQQWSAECAYLKINDDWGRLREWLGVPMLSEQVHSDWHWSTNLQAETAQVKERYQTALPYFLSLVREKQPSNFDPVVGRLQRLRLHVVEELSVVQRLRNVYVPPKTLFPRIHLQPADEPNPRGGRPVRAGDLYITREGINNPDLLGSRIANYIEIERLSDAFVLLYERDNHEARWRYLESNAVAWQTLDDVRQRLGQDEGTGETDSNLQRLDEMFKRQTVTPALAGDVTSSVPFPPPELRPALPPDVGGDLLISVPDEKEPEFPPLDIGAAISFETYEPGSGQPPMEHGGHGGGAGGPGISRRPPPEKVRQALGQRGEKWAYETEKQRLRKLGLDPESLEREKKLDWVATREPYAAYDIRSVDKTPDGQTDIWIEVKATAGNDGVVEMSIEQFKLASSLGDRYWLYWISNAGQACPRVTRYQNPVKLWQDGEIQLDFRRLELTLPRS